MATLPYMLKIMPKSFSAASSLQNPLVVALAYDGLCTFEFGVAVEMFGLPRPEMGEGWYRFAVASVDPGELRATGGVRLVADGGIALLAEAGTIIVPGWRGADQPVPEALCAALREAHDRGARVLSICSGVFVLAAGPCTTGLPFGCGLLYPNLFGPNLIFPAVVLPGAGGCTGTGNFPLPIPVAPGLCGQTLCAQTVLFCLPPPPPLGIGLTNAIEFTVTGG